MLQHRLYLNLYYFLSTSATDLSVHGYLVRLVRVLSASPCFVNKFVNFGPLVRVLIRVRTLSVVP